MYVLTQKNKKKNYTNVSFHQLVIFCTRFFLSYLMMIRKSIPLKNIYVCMCSCVVFL